jgi:hypothetical protein
MANPIDGGMVSPPPPNPEGRSMSGGSDFNRLTGAGMPAGVGQMQQGQGGAPSHAETSVAIRHFMMVIDELKELWKNEALGRTDMKSQIIDGVTGLVAKRMMSAASAVQVLADVPSDPIAQRKWVKQMLAQTVQAQNGVLNHHVAGHAPTLDWATESQHQTSSPDDHLQTMEGLAGRYRR